LQAFIAIAQDDATAPSPRAAAAAA
jgi:hypothetical protein